MAFALSMSGYIVSDQNSTYLETKVRYDGNLYLQGLCDNVESFQSDVLQINSSTIQMKPYFTGGLSTVQILLNGSSAIQFQYPLNKPSSDINGHSYFNVSIDLSEIKVYGNNSHVKKTFIGGSSVQPQHLFVQLFVSPTSRSKCDYEMTRSVNSFFVNFVVTTYTIYVFFPILVLMICNDSVMKTQNNGLEDNIIRTTTEVIEMEEHCKQNNNQSFIKFGKN